MIYLKYFLKGHSLNFYGPFDPNINPHLCHDMTYPPTKFDVVSPSCLIIFYFIYMKRVQQVATMSAL